MKFTESHEWIKLEGDIGTIGITDHAQHELGEIVYIEFPLLGRDIKAGQEMAVLESTKAATDIYSPVSGKIIEINDALKENPERINNSPELEGWICKIKITDRKEYDLLFDAIAYKAMLHGRI